MRVLLDECVPSRVRRDLPGHVVRTVVEMGWSGVQNGELLKRASAEFDCFLTVDRNLQFQESVSGLTIGVVVVHAQGNDFASLHPLMPKVQAALEDLKRGQVANVRS